MSKKYEIKQSTSAHKRSEDEDTYEKIVEMVGGKSGYGPKRRNTKKAK